MEPHVFAEKIIEGPCAEVGVASGGHWAIMHEAGLDLSDRLVFLFDTWKGFPNRLDVGYWKHESRTLRAHPEMFDFKTLSKCRDELLKLPGYYVYFEGIFPDTLPRIDGSPFAYVHLDADMYWPTYYGIKKFVPLLKEGGIMALHDYNNKTCVGVNKAVDEMLCPKPEWKGRNYYIAFQKQEGEMVHITTMEDLK